MSQKPAAVVTTLPRHAWAVPFALLLGTLVAPGIALGQESSPADARASDAPSSADVAVQAAEVLDQHCANVAGGRATESARALSIVGPVLADVSAAHDATKEDFLLFWRGRLNLCLDREERAEEDLRAFVARVGAEPGYEDQARQAKALLRRLERGGGASTKVQTPGAAAVGGVLVGASGVFGGLSAWQWQVAADRHADYDLGERPWSQTEGIGNEALEAETRSRVLVGSSIGAGVGAVISFVLSGVRTGSPGGAAQMGAMVIPLPEGGVSLSVGGAW